MNATVYTFSPKIRMQKVADTLSLSLLALESLNSTTRVRSGVRYHVDIPNRACVIERGSRLGDELSLLFLGYLRREFAPASFSVHQVRPEIKSPIMTTTAA